MARLPSLQPRIAPIDLRSAPPAPKRANAFYLTPQWREARAICIALANFRCAKCGRRDCMLFADHVIEIQDGGALLDQGNLEALCGSCHTAKTASEREKRMAKVT